MASPDFKNRKTPGVYITEIPAFPPSVVGVPTAIPVFVGYTERAEVSGKPIYRRPVLIRSLADYEQVFGGGYRAVYNLAPVTPSSALRRVGTAAVAGGESGGTPAATDDYDFAVLDDSSPPKWMYYDLTASTVAARRQSTGISVGPVSGSSGPSGAIPATRHREQRDDAATRPAACRS